jgi:hypothetical protein
MLNGSNKNNAMIQSENQENALEYDREPKSSGFLKRSCSDSRQAFASKKAVPLLGVGAEGRNETD